MTAAVASLDAIGFILPECKLVCAFLAVFVSLSAFFGWLNLARRQQSKTDAEETRLTASIAVRRKSTATSMSHALNLRLLIALKYRR